MGNCKFKARKSYYSTLDIIFNLVSPNEYIILGNLKFKAFITAAYSLKMTPNTSDNDIFYFGNFMGFMFFASTLKMRNDIVYVISKKDLNKILINWEDLVQKEQIDINSYKSIQDFKDDLEAKTGISVNLGYTESDFIPKEQIIATTLENIFRKVVQDKIYSFLKSVHWWGKKTKEINMYD